MPRVKISSPSSDVIKQHPRAFAIYKQVAGEGEAEVEALQTYLRQYGSADSVNGESLTFEEFAGLFAKPPVPAVEGDGNCVGYASMDTSGTIVPFRFTRRDCGAKDVRIQITHAGICHSDLHQARNDWKNSSYPMVPGHENVGFVTEVGSEVTKFKVGDRVGVGCMVNSCQSCAACLELKEEQYCLKMVATYNGKEADGTPTQGGYSAFLLCDEKFVLSIPDALPLETCAPLLCAGITVYSPMKFYGLDKPGMKLGVAGLGGLGHMAVKFAKAMGMEVTVLSTSLKKKDEALEVLKADHFLVTSDQEAMGAAFGSLDGIINTISAEHDLQLLLTTLKVGGKMVCVGAPENPPKMPTFFMLFRRLSVGGSLIGGIKETQEMLEFCAKHNVLPMTETIKADYINEAYARMLKNDVRYRFVIDVLGSIIV